MDCCIVTVYMVKKKRCPTNICDGIMEEILKSHGSSPPQPFWQNTDIQKWCSEPWEVAKCYIIAPGYSDKTNAADIDISGLLHVFINNINLHSHITCSMTGTSNIFIKVRGRRNSIFHSATMEMEDTELTECVDDIIAILEDNTELKMRKDAQQAVTNLNKLKTDDLIITTQNEMEVCREALSTITRMAEELKQLIHDTKEDISMKQADASKVIDDEIQTALKDALDLLSNNGEIKNLELAMKLIDAKVDRLDSDYKQRLSKIEDDITAFKDIDNQKKTKERLEYLENKQKLQDELVKYYKKYYVNTSLTPLKQQQDSINVKDVYVLPEIKVLEEKKDINRRGRETARNSKPHSAEEAEVEQDKVLYSRKPDVETNQLDKVRSKRKENQSMNIDKSKPKKNNVKGYLEEKQYMNRRGRETAINSKPHSSEEAEEEQDKILYSRKPDVETNQLDNDRYKRKENQSMNTDKSKPENNTVKEYHENFQAKAHKKIYILGDVGTGKSTFCKMMIENWCDVVKSSTNELIRYENGHDATKTASSDVNRKSEYDNVSQVAQYEFLFYIPLQYMSAFKSDATVEMIKEITRDLTSNTELIDKIFQEDSMRCLIIVDSLDEWTPPKEIVRKPHVSYGIPNGDRAKDATVITLSRPSAIGILNLKNSEVDLKLQLLGISGDSLRSFIERYISNTQVTNKTCDEFIQIMKAKQIEHVENTPLFLQQLLWLYCNGLDIGRSVCETYCQILNTMCGWSDHRKDELDEDASLTGQKEDNKNLNLTKSLSKFPRIKRNIRVLFRLGKLAFEAFTSDNVQATFGLSIFEKHLSKDDIKELTDLGILNKSTCFGQMFEDTQFSFIHISYIEFFAAFYVAIYYSMEETAPVYREASVLNLLFCRCKSSSDVVQLSNVIKMVCGLSPDLIGDLSKRISSIVNTDGHTLQRRINNDTRYYSGLIQIQRLMVNCLNECDSDRKTKISLSDLFIVGDEPIPPLQRIKPECVISLSIDLRNKFGEYVKDIQTYVTQCKHVQYMAISSIQFEKHESFPLSFSGNVSLKLMNLIFLDNCDIDFSMPNQLHALVLDSCSVISISHLDTEQLKSIYIEDCAGIDFSCFLTARKLTEIYLHYCVECIDITPLRSILQQALFLRQLTLDSVHDEISYDYIHIDLSRHHHLQKVKLTNCSFLVITGLNTEQLEEVYIDNNDLMEFVF
ncbi:uncharacterized protein LOC132715107 [Ruditapes philippinarum]|uniref:uncharacterized protein LOC132715107 n=1 Tax=Ruditapes philippinarum TaxID=129788 RepID=UPI00295AB436|nr:uncharacterized protein LOC132715107 [Ruditapes philippinarum]